METVSEINQQIEKIRKNAEKKISKLESKRSEVCPHTNTMEGQFMEYRYIECKDCGKNIRSWHQDDDD